MAEDCKLVTEEMSSNTDSEDNIKFKDPLLTGFDDDSDDGEMESLDLDASGRSDISQISRSSSLIANFKLDEDSDSETRDLFCVVDNPEKHSGTMESYITFRVSTKTSRSEFEDSEYQVRRRYKDFLWLRQILQESYPTHLVAPLPEKHSLRRLDRFSQDFLRIRQTALQKFLTRIADHPVLSFDKHFQVFLTTKAWEFQAHKKQGTGLIGRVTDSLHNMGTSYLMKNRSPEFTVMHEYIQTFGEKLGSMDRISQRIVKEQADYLSEWNEWAPVFTLWSNSEDQLSSALITMSNTVENCCQELKHLIDSTDDKYSQPLKEYILYAEAIKAVLRRRDSIQNEYDTTVDELNKRKDEREQVKTSDQSYSVGAFLGKDPDDVKSQKLDKLEQQIEDLTKQVEVLNDKTVVANADLKADMERWHKNKQRDMKDILMGLADRNIEYYQKCLDSWEKTIRVISTNEDTAGSAAVKNDSILEDPSSEMNNIQEVDSENNPTQSE